MCLCEHFQAFVLIRSPLVAGLPHDDVEVACPGLRFEATDFVEAQGG